MACCRWALVGQAVGVERKASVVMSSATRTWSWPPADQLGAEGPVQDVAGKGHTEVGVATVDQPH
jgi:hypothetical protein